MNALTEATALVTDELILLLLPEREREECRKILTDQNKTE